MRSPPLFEVTNSPTHLPIVGDVTHSGEGVSRSELVSRSDSESLVRERIGVSEWVSECVSE